MSVSIVHGVSGPDQRIADQNRRLLEDARVLTINVIGGLGCGKTTLIGQTLARLVEAMHVGLLTCDPGLREGADHLAGTADQMVPVDTEKGGLLKPGHVQKALGRLDLRRLDLLFIENVSSIVGPAELDIGEHVKAAVFSVGEGDDKAAKHPEVVSRSQVLILNKMDLIGSVSFNLAAFRGNVHRLNRDTSLFELSALHGERLEPWLNWLRAHVMKRPQQPSRESDWFG